MIRQGSMSNLSSISNISRIPKDKNGIYNDDESLMDYEVFVTNSKTRNKVNNDIDLNNKNFIYVTTKKNISAIQRNICRTAKAGKRNNKKTL